MARFCQITPEKRCVFFPTAAPAVNPEIIRHYDAHVYYDPASSRDRAARLRSAWRRPSRTRRLRSRSCIIDGEAVACGDDGIASFDRIRHHHYDDSVFLYAFDLIEPQRRRFASRPAECAEGHARQFTRACCAGHSLRPDWRRRAARPVTAH
jgi:hypothetical protein